MDVYICQMSLHTELQLPLLNIHPPTEDKDWLYTSQNHSSKVVKFYSQFHVPTMF